MRRSAFALAGWTLLIWATRIRNALGDDSMSGRAKAFAVLVSLAFTFAALAVIVAALRRGPLVRVLGALASVTIIYWPIRVAMVISNGHSAGFVAVHTALGVISVALALWAWPYRQRSRGRAGLLPGG